MAKENRTVNASAVRSRTALSVGGARQGTSAGQKKEQRTASTLQGKTTDQKTTAGNDKAKALDEMTGMRRRLFLRITLAGAVMLVLLGGIVLFEYYGGSSQPMPVETPPESVTQTKVDTPEISEPPVEIPPPEVAEVVDETPAVPELTAPPVNPPPPPEVLAQPRLPVSSAAPRNVQASSRAGTSIAEESKSSGKRLVRAPEQPSPEALQNMSLAPPRLISGYALQAGVFADPKRAEELHAKLTLAGIPSTIEARVQVGPFKSRAEAETARKKLEAMGIGSILLPQGKTSKHGSLSGK